MHVTHAVLLAACVAAAAGLSLHRCAGGCRESSAVARIEMVKQQILGKLRLQEAPRPNLTMAALPRPLAAAHGRQQENSFEDFYGKTDQVILFPDAGVEACPDSPSAALCFSFSLPQNLADESVVDSAGLWLNRHTFQAARGDEHLFRLWAKNSSALPQLQLIASVWSKIKDSWMQVKLDVVDTWVNKSQLHQKIQIECTTCQGKGQLREDQLPFLVISTRSLSAPQRVRRSINCTPGIKECCRENLRINFDEIGWGNWILQPKGYDAFFCRGSCTNGAAIAQSGSFYTSIIQKYLSLGLARTKNKVDLTPCCTPTKFSSLQLLYVDSNNVVMQKTLPNMVVDSCGCL
ncbi:inhibin beta A chain [Neocloeon triangulifer]|uniref:inhibin beta A chain n=1 Tax=Neocloeon triangulifer TaxID=2078957 RepID=UPI00286F510E|nr:inhibin beta A chain [Neocloeon triangulifer]